GGGEQRVLSIVHRGGASVIGKAFDGHIPPVDAHDPFDDADVDPFFLKDAALFDVQFEISGDASFGALDGSKLRRIAADKLDALANCLAAAADEIKFSLRQLTIHCTAADQTAFFVLKDYDFERVARDD